MNPPPYVWYSIFWNANWKLSGIDWIYRSTRKSSDKNRSDTNYRKAPSSWFLYKWWYENYGENSEYWISDIRWRIHSLLLKIYQYIRGYVRIRITGHRMERFINACNYRKIKIWDLSASDGSYEMNLWVKDFKKLRHISHKTPFFSLWKYRL